MAATDQTRYKALLAVKGLLDGPRPADRIMAGDTPITVHTQRQPQISDWEELAIVVQLVRDERQWDLECSMAQRWHLSLQIGVLQRQLCDATALADVLEQVIARLEGAMDDATFKAALPEAFDVRCGEVEWAPLNSSDPVGTVAMVTMEVRYQRYPGST